MKATAITYTGIGQVELRTFEPRALQPGEVLVETAYTCISPGTELRLLTGGQKAAFPMIPGYCIAGRVIQTQSDIPVGARVVCTGTVDASPVAMGGGQLSHAIIPASLTTPIPDNVELLEATTCVLAAIALRGVRMSRPRLGELTVVIGLGVIGQFAARVHALAGARVIGVDRTLRRVELLRAVGLEAVVPEGDLATLAPLLGEGPTLIVDATGVPAVLPQALALARMVPLSDAPQADNRYLVQGSYGGGVTFDYHDAFRRQMTFLVPKAHQPQDRASALELMRRRQLKGRDIITEVRRPEEAPRTYRELQDPQAPLMTVAFAWNDAPL